MEDALKFPMGPLPLSPPKEVPADVIGVWRTEWRSDLHRQGLLMKMLEDPNRVPRGPRFHLYE